MVDDCEINRRSIDELRDLIASEVSASHQSHPGYEVSLHDRSSISAADLQSCFDLVKGNLQSIYEGSSWGWKPAAKLEELKEADTKYLLVHSPASSSEELLAFLSCQMVDEDGEAVIYCYELQLVESIRHRGIGRDLMQLMHRLGQVNGICRSMLTVFRANERATKFYKELGYETDRTSPKDLLLRGRVVQADYIIMTNTI